MAAREFKPILADTIVDIGTIVFPVLVSPKLDGIRCCIRPSGAGTMMPVSRNLKPIPNRSIRDALLGMPPFDGELICGSPVEPSTWNKTQSGVMSADGEPDWTYWVFDAIPTEGTKYLKPTIETPFQERIEIARQLVRAARTTDTAGTPRIQHVSHKWVYDLPTLLEIEEQVVAAGYEGLMLRDPHGRYKFGRATLRSRELLKFVRKFTAEAVVEGFVEQMHNTNLAKLDELGRTKRSSAKAGKVGKATLGALLCRMPDGSTFEIGTGLDDATRADIWSRQAEFAGKTVTYEYRQLTPAGVPRFPVFKGWRDAGDTGG